MTATEIPPTEAPASTFYVNPELLGEDAGTALGLPPGVYRVGDVLPPDRMELFRVNDRSYTVPRVADPRLMFRMIRGLRKSESRELAIADMLYDVLGESVIDALADEDLSAEEMQQVMKAVSKYAMSAMERSGLGNS